MAALEQRHIVGLSLNESPYVGVWSINSKGQISNHPIHSAKLGGIDYSGSEVGLQMVHRLKEMQTGLKRDGFRLDACGVSVPGNVDQLHGRILNIARMHVVDTVNNNGSHEKPTPIDLSAVLKSWSHVVIDNDVTCAALGEYFEEGHKGKTFAYIYIDRGVNIGIVKNGRAWRGRINPEIGHFNPRFDAPEKAHIERRKAVFHAVDKMHFCPLHERCFEKLLARPAVEQYAPELLLSESASPRPATYVSEFVAQLLSQLCEIVALCFSPDIIAIAGYPDQSLIDQVRAIFVQNMHGFALATETPNLIRRSKQNPEHMAAYGAAVQAFFHMEETPRKRDKR